MSSSRDWTDWTHPLGPGSPVFGAHWHRSVSFESTGSMETVGRRVTQCHIGTHAGTHIDAPSHFLKQGISIDQLPLSRFSGILRVIDFSHVKPGREVSLDEFQKQLDNETLNDAGLALFFDWSKWFGSDKYFSDQPFLTQETAIFIAEMSPKIVAYDLAMPDNPREGYGQDQDSPVHKIFLSRGIPLVENCRIVWPGNRNLEYFVFPLPLVGLDGSPARFVVRQTL